MKLLTISLATVICGESGQEGARICQVVMVDTTGFPFGVRGCWAGRGGGWVVAGRQNGLPKE